MTSVRVALATLSGVVLFAVCGLAVAAGANDTCLACHADADAKAASGKSIAVDSAKFAKSVHGELSLDCTACHTDVSPTKIPHADKLKPVDCSSCHAQPVKEYVQTVHAKARKDGNRAAATCIDCHSKHDIRRAKDPASRTNHANLEATCAACHGNEKFVKEAKLPGGNIGSQFHDSIHGKALTGAAQASAPTCTNCHGAHDIRPKSDEASRVARAHIPDTCGSCHQAIKAKFEHGQHGKLRHEGNLAAPGCTDCHSAHQIKRHDTPAFQTGVIEECGNCHAEYLSTYRDTFHGQVTKLGYANMATCASCHGAHDILPASDPASTVSAQNRVKTCQQCHAGASAKLASFDPHANRHDKARNPLYFYAAMFMEWLLIGVFAFFGIHTIFWLSRLWIEKFKRAKGKGN